MCRVLAGKRLLLCASPCVRCGSLSSALLVREIVPDGEGRCAQIRYAIGGHCADPIGGLVLSPARRPISGTQHPDNSGKWPATFAAP